MPECATETHPVKEINPQGLRGPLWTLAGTAIGALATQWLGGGAYGGFGGVGNNAAMAAVAAGGAGISVIAEMDAEIARLKSEKYTDGQVKQLYTYQVGQDEKLLNFLTGVDKRLAALETAVPLREQITEQKIAAVAQQADCCCKALNAAIANLQATLASITKTVVPNTAVCPGWGDVNITIPTTTTTTP